jgi:hypothetical protein
MYGLILWRIGFIIKESGLFFQEFMMNSYGVMPFRVFNRLANEKNGPSSFSAKLFSRMISGTAQKSKRLMVLPHLESGKIRFAT